MRGFLSRYVVLPAFETLWKRRRTFRYLKDLNQSQWLTRQQLDELQLGALTALLSHAQEHCEYYRSAWNQAGLDPRQVRSVEDFRKWPVIDREVIRANRNQMRAQVPGMTLLSKATGGSTGEPLHFDLNTDSHDRRTAASYRGYEWAGAGPGTRQLHLWGVSLAEMSRRGQWKDDLYHRLHRRKFLSTFGLSAEHFQEYLGAYNRFRPDAIVAYTSSLYEFARMIQDRGAKAFSPKSIIAGAEKLLPFQRELIENVFGAPVFETYGSREFMLMAAECERHHGMHVTQENLLIEIVDADGRPVPDGQEGDVVVTDLYNYGMPFIRYKNGDRAVMARGRCSCGRGLPLLEQVTGRVVDVVRTPDDRRISGVFFPHLMKDFPSVVRFQVIQDRLDHVQVRIVPTPSWNDGVREAIERAIRQKLGPMVHLELSVVDEIPLTSAGKLRPVVSRCGDSDAPSSQREAETVSR